MEIKGYQIEKEIGRGGMATVYLAIQTALERQIALKVMNPALSADPDFTVRFLREGPIAAKLNDPQIVTIYDTGVDENHYYLAMEYLPGGTLKQRIKKGIPVEQALTIGKMLGSALGYAHSRGVLHRDVKPQNILFRDNGTPVLTDFGIAKAVGGNTQMTAPGTSIGSPMYMSPEQANGLVLDERSDIYALGVVFFEILTGRTPYQSKDTFALALMHMNEPIPQLPAELGVFQTIIDKLLAKDPDDRFKIAEQFVEALKQAERAYYAAQQTPEAFDVQQATQRIQPLNPPSDADRTRDLRTVGEEQLIARPGQRRGRRGWVWGLGIAAVLAAAVGLGYFVTTRPPNVDALLDQAHQQESQGDYAASLNTIEQGLELNPNNLALLNLRNRVNAARQRAAEIADKAATAGQLLDADQPQQALTEIKAGLALAPGHGELNELRQRADQMLALRARKEKIQRLLADAERQMAAGKLADPDGDNAAKSYLQVLDLDAANDAARAGLQRIADQYLERAKQSQGKRPLAETIAALEKGLTFAPGHAGLQAMKADLDQEAKQLQLAQRAFAIGKEQLAEEKFDAALATVDGGLQAMPGYQPLLDLRDQIVADQATALAAQQLTELTEQARSLRARGQFKASLAKLDRALQLQPEQADLLDLRAALQADLDKLERQQRLGEVVDQARQLREQGELDQALATVDRGLAQSPDDPDLLELRQILTDQRDRTARIDQLLAAAEQQLQRSQFTTPDDNNAFDSYQQVLELDPDNPTALAGLKRVADEYVRLTERTLDGNNGRDPLEYIGRGLNVQPDYPPLLALQALIKAGSLLQKGELDASLAAVRQGLQAQPDQQRLIQLQTEIDRQLAERQRRNEAEQQLLAGRQLRQRGELHQALDAVSAGLALIADHPALTRLQRELRTDMAAAEALAEAQRLADQNRYDEALQRLQRGLQTAPDNADLAVLHDQLTARQADQQRYQQAEQLYRQARSAKPEAALGLTEQGLQLAPDHAGLVVLNNHLIAEQIRRSENSELLAEVQRLGDRGKLLAALELVRERLRQQPLNEELLTAQEQIALALIQQSEQERQRVARTQLINQAEQLADRGDFEAALALLGEQLDVNPDQPDLVQLQADIRQRQATAATLAEDQAIDRLTAELDAAMGLTNPPPATAEGSATGTDFDLFPDDLDADPGEPAIDPTTIDQLLATADRYMAANALTTPRDENAYDVYRQVLELQPDNVAAAAGVDAIVNTYTRWARGNVAKNNLDQALINIRKGLSIQPRNSTLLRLRRQVQTRIAALETPPRPTVSTPPPVSTDPCARNPNSQDCRCQQGFGTRCDRR